MTKRTYRCQQCSKEFAARVADRRRGWALFCSKSCKATKQAAKRHAMWKALNRQGERDALPHGESDDWYPDSAWMRGEGGRD